MRILLVNDYGTPTGGAENMVLMLRDAYRARGHDARLFSSSARPVDVPVAADDVCLGTTSPVRTLLQSANVWAAYRLRQVLADFQPHVVHVRLFLTQLSPLILPLLREAPSLLHVADYRPICPVGRKQLPDGTPCFVAPGGACYREGCLPLRDWVPLMLQMRLWHRWRDAFDAVVANSHWMADRLRRGGLAVNDVVWNGVPERSARPPLTAPPTVVFAGRLVPEKGVQPLLRAMQRVVREVPEARLLIAGRGPAEAALREDIDRLGLSAHVQMLGHLSRGALEDTFATAWVQAVPSTWEEPFGIVAAEAMMRGMAVVASRIGGLTEVVEDGTTGYTIPPGDASALAAALLRVLQNRDHAESLGSAGRRRARAFFSESHVVDRFLEIYTQLCATTSCPHPPVSEGSPASSAFSHNLLDSTGR